MEYNLEYAYGMKSLVENLFGKNAWLEMKHSTDLRKWKKYSTRILSAVECSAKATVEIVDDEWFDELNSMVELGKNQIKTVKTTEEVFAYLASTLANISFLQLGRIPSNVRHKQVSLRHQSNWKMNQYRSVQYVQSKEQEKTKKAHNKSINRTENTSAQN